MKNRKKPASKKKNAKICFEKAALFFRKHWIFFILLLLLILTRILIIPNSLFFIGDEAQDSMMGKLILTEEYRPLWFYDLQIGGGDAMLGYILSFFYAIFGISAFSARLASLFIVTLLFTLMYVVMRKYFDKKACFIALLLFVFPFSGFIERGMLILRYFLGSLFHLLIIFFFYKIIYEKKKTLLIIGLFGFACGFGSYIFIPNLIITIIALVIIAFLDLKFYKDKKILFFILFFLIGYSPDIYMTIASNAHNFDEYLHFEHIFVPGQFGRFDMTTRLGDAKNLFSEIMPYTMRSQHVIIHHQNYFYIEMNQKSYYAIFILLLIFLIIINLEKLIKLFKRKRMSPELIFLVYFTAYCLAFIFYWLKSDIYLMPLQYVTIIIMATGLSEMFTLKKIPELSKIFFKAVACILFIILLAFGANNVIKMISAGSTLSVPYEVDHVLKENNIKNVYTVNVIIGFIVTNSDGVKATTLGVEGENFYKKHEYLDKDKPFAIVLPNEGLTLIDSSFSKSMNIALENFLKEKNISFSMESTNSSHMKIYYNFSEYFRLEDYRYNFLWQRAQLYRNLNNS